MSWRRALDRALDGHPDAPGDVSVEGPSGSAAQVGVERAGPIGVRVRRVRVTRDHDRAVEAEAERLASDLSALPGGVAPVEVDPSLGGAVLRTRPERLQGRDFFEVTVDGTRDVEVRRQRITPDGREPATWDTTRESLGRLLDELDGTPSG